jgi:hypothetical protein
MALTIPNLTGWYRRLSLDSVGVDDSSLDLDGIGEGLGKIVKKIKKLANEINKIAFE